MNIYDLQQSIYDSIEDFGPNRYSLKKTILLHDLTETACYRIKTILEECNYEPKLRDVEMIEAIASQYREVQEISQRQILTFR